jgi:colanic acid/amylovoran biosynthesis glycosyltransferase
VNNCLILLTNYYPFYKGEEYLETEIGYLSNKFKQIYIIATMAYKGMEQTRKIPENAIALPVDIKHSICRKIKMVLHKGSSIHKDPNKREMLKKDSEGKIINRLYNYYFESRAMEIYDNVVKLLDNFDFDKYDSITLYSYWLYITARVAVELKDRYFNKKSPYTFSRAHGYDINEHANLLNFLPERKYLLDSLHNIFPVSQKGVNFLQTKYPKYANKIEVRRLGTRQPDIRLSLAMTKKSKCFHIVSCSTVRKLKRIDLIIDALKILQNKDIVFHWTHIGEGPQFKYIKKLANKKLNKDSFTFTGYIKNDEVINWYQQNPVNVFVNASSSEGVPVSIMEAMSMGIPIIATDVGGTSEIVQDNINGYLIGKDCTASQIAEKILNLYKMDIDKYYDMSSNSLAIWKEKCNSDTLYSCFAEQIAKYRANG